MKILIAAANGGIADAIGAELNRRGHELLTISRTTTIPVWSQRHFVADASDPDSVGQISNWLKDEQQVPDTIVQCAGILHDGKARPEKTLMQFSEEWFARNVTANVTAHVHLAQAVNYLVGSRSSLRWVSLSAMVGSISDNQLGGWYSYRMSKAALNMFVRNLHIEWTRKSPNSIAVALHPGTTDTALSKPFQANIVEGKLYDASLTGRRLADVIDGLDSSLSGQLLHWDGSELAF